MPEKIKCGHCQRRDHTIQCSRTRISRKTGTALPKKNNLQQANTKRRTGGTVTQPITGTDFLPTHPHLAYCRQLDHVSSQPPPIAVLWNC